MFSKTSKDSSDFCNPFGNNCFNPFFSFMNNCNDIGCSAYYNPFQNNMKFYQQMMKNFFNFSNIYFSDLCSDCSSYSIFLNHYLNHLEKMYQVTEKMCDKESCNSKDWAKNFEECSSNWVNGFNKFHEEIKKFNEQATNYITLIRKNLEKMKCNSEFEINNEKEEEEPSPKAKNKDYNDQSAEI